MKANYRHKFLMLLLVILCAAGIKTFAQDSVVSTNLMNVRYFLSGNKVPYIDVNTKKKTGKKLEPIKGIPVNVYFGEASEKNLLGKVTTGFDGDGKVALPPSFKATWDSLNEFKFLAVSDSAAGLESLSGDVTVKKAILVIDTSSSDETKTVTAKLKEKKGNEWVAVKDIEMKLGIKRLLGVLSVNEKETFTADSSGTASAEFKRDTIPGDEKGNIILVAKVDDNDSYGNLVVEKTVPWGKAAVRENNFGKRNLWSTGDRAPLWLLFTW
jgi:hypothetical protein